MHYALFETAIGTCAVVWGDPIPTEGYSSDREGYAALTEVVTEEIFKLWRLAGEAVVRGFPRELSDGARRFKPYIFPFVKNGDPPRLG